MSYIRPTTGLNVATTIKKSQFLGYLKVVSTAQDALDFVKEIKTLHPQANHSCHCFVAGSPDESSLFGYSDDGEPKGTAGLPMFQVLKHSGLGNTCVVVTRYFGGIKLGTGGIARAYSSLVSLLLEQIETEVIHQRQICQLSIPFTLTGNIENIFRQFKTMTIIDRQWLDSGQMISLSLEDYLMNDFKNNLAPYLHSIDFKMMDN
jgi:uncharacterized YigZ family protein